MEFNIFTLWYFLISIFSGVFAGMGMGGGTLLIPALTLILGTNQLIAQSINLLVFIPASIVAIVIYSRRKQVDFKGGLVIAIPAAIVSGVAAFFAVKIDSEILTIIFGSFIALIGIIQIIIFIIKKIKSRTIWYLFYFDYKICYHGCIITFGEYVCE